MGIQIDITREDGEVTRLRGESGIATCMGDIATNIARSDPPAVSLRCGNKAELAWNLASIMAAVRHVAPEAFEMAGDLMEFCDFDRPDVSRKLPPRRRNPNGGQER